MGQGCLLFTLPASVGREEKSGAGEENGVPGPSWAKNDCFRPKNGFWPRKIKKVTTGEETKWVNWGNKLGWREE